VDSGLTSRRGSGRSTKWTAAELLDTTRRRTGGGERGYGDGAAAVASAMAGEREGRSWGGEDMSEGFVGERGSDPRR